MAKYGYVYNETEADLSVFEWMTGYGCYPILVDRKDDERVKWKSLLNDMKRGDELVLKRFSNAVSSMGQFALFLEYCSENGIRIISIGDAVDSCGELFHSSPGEVLLALARFARDSALESISGKASEMQPETMKISASRQQREAKIVSMYSQGYKVDDIALEMGFRSRAGIYQVLKRSGIPRDRILRNPVAPPAAGPDPC